MSSFPVAKALPFLFMLALAGCSNRRDSPDFFRSITGISLCESASIQVDPRRDDLGIGFEYSTRLRLSPECKAQFFEEVLRLTGRDCRSETQCSIDYPVGQRLFISNGGESITVIASD
jgi:hypothetical protein